MNLNTETIKVSYKYAFGYNIITFSIPLAERRKSFIEDPVILAIIMGVVFGLICRQIPDAASSFIINELVYSVQDIY